MDYDFRRGSCSSIYKEKNAEEEQYLLYILLSHAFYFMFDL